MKIWNKIYVYRSAFRYEYNWVYFNEYTTKEGNLKVDYINKIEKEKENTRN